MLLFDNTCRLKQKDEQKYRSYEFNCCCINKFSSEFFTVFCNLVNDCFWLGNPADKNAGKQCKQRHKNIVAEIIKYIKNLTNGAVRQLELKVEFIVAKAYNCTEYKSVNKNDNSTFLS